ncbi:MAG: hypothetical protein U1A77_17780 [Pirellulales bacterium]
MSQSSLARWSVGIAALVFGLVTNAASLSEAREFRFQPDPEESGVASPSDIRPAQSRSVGPALIQKAPQQQIQSYKQVQVPVQAPIQKGNCCVPSCIRYFEHGRARRCCGPTYQTTLTYCDPCSDCMVCIPVCIPVCCDEPAQIVERHGAFGRSVVVFRWCCGYMVKVVTDRCGDVAVHQYTR